MLYKGRVVFWQYIPKKHTRFGIKNYKLCDSLGYTYDISMYLGKQRQHATARITATHGTVLQVIWRVEGLGHKILMDNYFTSPALFDNLFHHKMNVCGTVRNDRCGMPWDTGPKSLKMKRGDIMTRVGGSLRAVHWKDRRNVYIDKHAHSPCWRKFHRRMWPGYQTSCSLWTSQTEWSTTWICTQNVKVDHETVFSPNRHDHSKCISYPQVMWWQNGS